MVSYKNGVKYTIVSYIRIDLYKTSMKIKKKQQELFNSFPAAARYVLRDHYDLEKMLRDLQSLR